MVFSSTRWGELESALLAESNQLISNGTTSREQLALSGTRGVGGTRKSAQTFASEDTFSVKVLDGISYRLPLPVSLIESAGHFMVIKRWFKHVPETR